MQVSSKMGGFTLGEADILRQAISKKEHETIERMRVKFVAGAQKKGFSKEDALRVYDYIERFGEYGLKVFWRLPRSAKSRFLRPTSIKAVMIFAFLTVASCLAFCP